MLQQRKTDSGLPAPWFILFAAGLLLFCVGCQSFNAPPTNNLASVTITNRTMQQIAGAIHDVLAAHYFQGSQTGPHEFTYERPGSRMNNLAYGSYMFDEKVTIRVKLMVQHINDTQYLLSCQAALVEDAGDPVFQDSHQVRFLRKWPYEQLLQDIRKQLGE